MILCFTAFLKGQSPDMIREPEVAGMFYPGNSQELTSTIENYLSKTELVIDGKIGGLVSPHAGYVYSGPVAAWSYRQVQGNTYDVVVVIAPSHFEYFNGSAVYRGEFYETPLGRIPIDQELAKELADASPHIRLSNAGHDPSSMGQAEHSLEVQLPFLQKTIGQFKLVAIIMADQSWQNVEKLGEALAKVLKDKKALIVASSDLSHYHSYETAYKIDQSLIDYFSDFELKKIVQKCETREIEACGHGPIGAMMQACSLMGFKKSKVIKYATSGDVPVGEKSQVVGYLSGAVYK